MSRAGRISEGTFHRMARATVGFENMGRNMPPIRFRPPVDDGGGGAPIRVGKFSGPWGNDPGTYGASNIKPVTLYVMANNPAHPNDLHPELDGNGDPVIAVTINLFSYIPTPPSSGQMMWCAVVPFAAVSGEYETGEFAPGGLYPVPITKAYDSLWLLIAAEC